MKISQKRDQSTSQSEQILAGRQKKTPKKSKPNNFGRLLVVFVVVVFVEVVFDVVVFTIVLVIVIILIIIS